MTKCDFCLLCCTLLIKFKRAIGATSNDKNKRIVQFIFLFLLFSFSIECRSVEAHGKRGKIVRTETKYHWKLLHLASFYFPDGKMEGARKGWPRCPSNRVNFTFIREWQFFISTWLFFQRMHFDAGVFAQRTTVAPRCFSYTYPYRQFSP